MSDRAMMMTTTTPPPKSPRQNPTPQSPDLQKRNDNLSTSTDWTESETELKSLNEDRIAHLPDGQVRRMLTSAVAAIDTLQQQCKTLTAQMLHYKFNLDMLKAEEAERQMRQEVEEHLRTSNQALLTSQLQRSTVDEETFRLRHLKAKRRVSELTEDTKRQQLSIEHLKRALSSQSDFNNSMSRPNSAIQEEGGLDVLSDAAGLAQMRDRDQESPEGKPSSQTLLSPVAFPSSAEAGMNPAAASRKRRLSDSTEVDEQAKDEEEDEEDEERNEEHDLDDRDEQDRARERRQHLRRRLTFSSTSTPMTRSVDQITPMTPNSVRPKKLASSAMH